jgi:WD40 repeat protein/tRNA A-37 threonylcarbamoyl transferase component Bud32
MDKNSKKTDMNSHNMAILWGLVLEDLSIKENEINNYKILKKIGEGGMGIVYLAQQEAPIKRHVALKIIKLGMDSKQIIARFEAERQALALLEHPNIARIYDAGTTDTGRLYFVMEYIEGVPITEYCDHNKLSIEERLKLFIQVCEAIQHAHQKGIIHRDIKPSNIIVSVQVGKAVPKVIDFGIVKAISSPLTEKTMFTQQGQPIGTLGYISPEQADFKEGDIDTRTDIYSLGIVLYELLAGTLPFEPKMLREAGLAEMLRIIREEEPPQPSTKLSSLGDNATKFAQSRHIELSTLVRNLHKELEWIPLMAIRKDRDQRYKTAYDFAEDVQNYLDGNPLVAGPESGLYRFKKFVKKQKGLVAAVMSVLAVLVIGIIISTTLYIQAENAIKKTRKSFYSNMIALIQSEYKSANTVNVKRLLDECPEDLRNWEYDYLQKISDHSIMTLKGHEGRVDSLIFTPDCKRIVSASGSDGIINVWDLVTGKKLRKFKLDRVNSLIALSPNGRQAVSAGRDFTIEMWDIEGESLIKTFKGHKHRISCVVFSKDGTQIASSDIGSTEHNPTVIIWDVNSDTETSSIQHPGVGIAHMGFSPDGTRLISSSYQGPSGGYELRLWDITTGKLIREVSNSWDLGVWHFHGVEFDNTGKYILTANWGQAWVWDAETMQIIRGAPNADDFGSYRAIFSPDSQCFLTGGVFGTLKIWNNQNGRLQRTLPGHTETILSLAFSPYGTLVASGSEDGTIKIWNTAVDTEKLTLGYAHPAAPVKTVSFNPQGTLLASGATDDVIGIWDTDGWKRIGSLLGHSGDVTSVAFSPDGKQLVSGSKDMSIRIWDMESEPPTTLHVLQGHSDSVNSVHYSPDGKYIVSGSSDKTVKIWEASTGDLIITLEGHDAEINSVQYTLDGRQIISGSEDNTVRIWDVKTGKCISNLKGHKNGVNCVELSPDGKMIASGDDNGTLIIWDKKSDKLIFSKSGHLGPITDIIFSPDSKRIFTSSSDDSIRIWEADSGNCLLALRGFSGGIYALSISQDGETLVAGANDFGNMFVISSQDQKEDLKEVISEAYCKYNLVSATKELEKYPQKIPSQAKLFNNHHYLLFMKPMNWKEAKKFAESTGGHLATITTKDENDWVAKTFPNDLGRYWLGGTNEESEGKWEWITGEEWSYSNWNTGEPNNQGGRQHALQVFIDGRWDDENMAIEQYFLIEWDR